MEKLIERESATRNPLVAAPALAVQFFLIPMAVVGVTVLVYLGFGLYVTFGTGLSLLGAVASFVLFLMELTALFLAASFTFESLDVICRARRRCPNSSIVIICRRGR